MWAHTNAGIARSKTSWKAHLHRRVRFSTKATSSNQHKETNSTSKVCLIKWALLPCSEAGKHENLWQIQNSCCRRIFNSNICRWIIPASDCVCVCASYYFVFRPSGFCRFQKNSSSIFMWVYAFINVAANCLRSSSQLVSAVVPANLADRGRRQVSERARERKRERELSEGVWDGENKERAITAAYGTVFPADEKTSLKEWRDKMLQMGETEKKKGRGHKKKAGTIKGRREKG